MKRIKEGELIPRGLSYNKAEFSFGRVAVLYWRFGDDCPGSDWAGVHTKTGIIARVYVVSPQGEPWYKMQIRPGLVINHHGKLWEFPSREWINNLLGRVKAQTGDIVKRTLEYNDKYFLTRLHK